jgi:hypothetical protein
VLDDGAARARLEQMHSVQGGLDDEKVLYTTGVSSYQGLWWNTAESGWRINLAHQGDLVYLTWYTYDASGRASWLAMLASRVGGETFAGDVVEVRGSPYDVAPYDPTKKVVSTVGTGTLAFSGRDAGTFSYTAKNVTRSVAITRFSLGGPALACTYAPTPDFAAASNYQDLWWGGPAEDGWGLNLAHEGDTIYAAWYTFDADGAPLWFSALMTQTSAGRYAGALTRASGPPFGATFDPSRVALATVGSAELVVQDGNAVAWRHSIGPTSGNQTLSRYLFRSPAGTLCR